MAAAYIFTNVDPTIHAARGFEVPVTPGVRLHHLLTVSLNNAGTIDHVVNDTGAPVEPAAKRQHDELRRQLPVIRAGRSRTKGA